MKGTILAAILVLSELTAGLRTGLAAGTAVELSGGEFVALLASQNFAGAFGRFDPAMKAALPVEKLQQTWETLQQQTGRFQKQVRSRSQKFGGYDVVLVTCQFERSQLDAKVVFDEQGRVAGLFFVPTQPAPGPDKPPPYVNTNAFRETEVKIGTGDWVLPGTLTLPSARAAQAFSAVVLVHGSGPNDRDETIGPNKPFRDLAWGLAGRGIAVLRYEKRTKEHGTKFMTTGAITVKEETIDDALLAAALLRKTEGIDPARVFVLGHSLGGMVAPRIGQADPALAGLIILAGATRPLEDLMLEQTRYILSLDGKLSPEAETKLAEIERDVGKVKRLSAADAASNTRVLGAPAKYWLDLRQYDPAATAKLLKMPLLILQGQRDYQVGMADFDNWKNALRSSTNATFKLYPDLNHLFVAGEGKSKPAEYEKSGYVSEAVIQDIAAWIRNPGATTK